MPFSKSLSTQSTLTVVATILYMRNIKSDLIYEFSLGSILKHISNANGS